MSSKWIIYFLTFLSYATIHSVRTMWSAIKSDLTMPPFNYQVHFLGALDMIVLFTLSIFLNILGPKVQKYGAKKSLIIGMIGLIGCNTLVGYLLVYEITWIWLYIIFFALGVGVFSSLGWPSCLYMLSFYFDKKNTISLSIWNGTSQLGDCIALATYYLVVAANNWKPQSSFFILLALMVVFVLLDLYFIPNELTPRQSIQKPSDVLVEEEVNKCIVEKEKEKIEIESNQTNSETGINKNQKIIQQPKKINIFNVWCLPGVAINVFAYGLIKSVNSFIVSWMIYYLLRINLQNDAFILTIFWSIGVFAGGIIFSLLNKNLNKLIFVIALVVSTILFVFLESFHQNIYQTQIMVGIVLCALFYGGPYNLMSTAIPISLSEQQQVQKLKGSRAAIISLMQGFGHLASAISLLLVPVFGVNNINIAGASYCGIAAFLFLMQIYRRKMDRKRKIMQNRQMKKNDKQQITANKEVVKQNEIQKQLSQTNQEYNASIKD